MAEIGDRVTLPDDGSAFAGLPGTVTDVLRDGTAVVEFVHPLYPDEDWQMACAPVEDRRNDAARLAAIEGALETHRTARETIEGDRAREKPPEDRADRKGRIAKGERRPARNAARAR